MRASIVPIYMAIFEVSVKIISNLSLREVKNCNGISKKGLPPGKPFPCSAEFNPPTLPPHALDLLHPPETLSPVHP